MFKSEKSFQIEVFLGIFMVFLILYLKFSFLIKIILFFSGFIVLLVETLNTAIENTVDLVTDQVHPLAKAAKDLGSGAVLLALILNFVIWVSAILHTYFGLF